MSIYEPVHVSHDRQCKKAAQSRSSEFAQFKISYRGKSFMNSEASHFEKYWTHDFLWAFRPKEVLTWSYVKKGSTDWSEIFSGHGSRWVLLTAKISALNTVSFGQIDPLKNGFLMKIRVFEIGFLPNIEQFEGWACKIGRLIWGLQLHERISLGRPETTRSRGHLWKLQTGRYVFTESTMIIFSYLYAKVHIIKKTKKNTSICSDILRTNHDI